MNIEWYQERIDDLIDEWHNDDSVHQSLSDFLQMNNEEYNTFLLGRFYIPEQTKQLIHQKFKGN